MRKYIVAIFVSLMMVLTMSPANAVDERRDPPGNPPWRGVKGCSSKVVLKADTWGNDVFWFPPTRLPTPKKERLVGTTAYWYCPNGNGVNKIKPKWVQWCWTHLSDRWSSFFDGVKFNANYFDDNTEANPPQTKIEDDESIQNCRQQDVKASTERWLRMDQGPAWTVSSWIVIRVMSDHHWDFRTYIDEKKSYVKYFHPTADPNLGKWHW